ncbi:hypothetical protein [Microvirga calopogonii]|uniref:hypothetical protein n=1 Tax=Microvirga calopogonii TaxID=2078013 RepID=UPI0013B3DC00|nr:hypothetical protein [Microvirga calopogonii]
MRPSVTFPLLMLAGIALSGCASGAAPMGVLPRDPVPPPPSISGNNVRPSAAAPRTGSSSQRRGLSVPGQTSAPRP